MPSLRPKHLKRYQDVIGLLIKHGHSDMVRKSGIADLINGIDEITGRTEVSKAENLAEDLEKLGPTYIKFGQLLSTRPDLLPEVYLDSLAKLQSGVSPLPFDEVKTLIEKRLGGPLEKFFDKVDPQPLAAASLGQVHLAVLLDSRTRVAVKVLRPGLQEQIIDDLDAFEDLAELVDDYTQIGRRFGFRNLVDTFRVYLLRELDLRIEANHLATLAENLSEHPLLTVPKVYDELSNATLLTMEFVPGCKIDKEAVAELPADECATKAKQLFDSYIDMVLVDGFFHADPHPGNLILKKTGQIAMIDAGMCVRLTPMQREGLAKLLLAISEGLGEDAASLAIQMGVCEDDFSRGEFTAVITRLVSNNLDATMRQMSLGHLVLNLLECAGENGVRLPEEMTLLSKTLLNLDLTLSVLDPEFNITAAIREKAGDTIRKMHKPDFSMSQIYRLATDSSELMSHLPQRVNKIMTLLADNQLRVSVDAIDEKSLLDGIHKVANRITLGLLLSSLVVAAALIMNIETAATLFGYPILAILLFLFASAGALALCVNIFLRDR